MSARPSLLLLTAAAAATASVGNAVGIATAPAASSVADDANADGADRPTRLGVAIADDMATRDRAAARRGRALDLREQAVRAAEARMAASAPDPALAPAAAASPGTAGQPTAADQYDDLARIYQAMKPAAAAVVMEQLDLDVQMRVAQKMRERSTAMIMGAMTPKAAAALTMALARRQATRPVATTGARPAAGRR